MHDTFLSTTQPSIEFVTHQNLDILQHIVLFSIFFDSLHKIPTCEINSVKKNNRLLLAMGYMGRKNFMWDGKVEISVFINIISLR